MDMNQLDELINSLWYKSFLQGKNNHLPGAGGLRNEVMDAKQELVEFITQNYVEKTEGIIIVEVGDDADNYNEEEV